MKKLALRFALAVLLASLFSFELLAFKEQTLPPGLPPGLPDAIKGKYRIIEHDTYKKHWIVYDVNNWNKQKEKLGGVELSGEEVRMSPPVTSYEYQNGKWSQQIYNEPITNIYQSHLVTIIKAGSSTKKPPKEEKQMGAEKAKGIIWSRIKYKSAWRIETFKHGSGILLCGYNTAMPSAIGAWWCKGDQIYNINGIAANITGNFEFTDDVSIDTAMSVCRK